MRLSEYRWIEDSTGLGSDANKAALQALGYLNVTDGPTRTVYGFVRRAKLPDVRAILGATGWSAMKFEDASTLMRAPEHPWFECCERVLPGTPYFAAAGTRLIECLDRLAKGETTQDVEVGSYF